MVFDLNAIGAARTIELLQQEDLAIPAVIAEAASAAEQLCDTTIDSGRFFVIAA